MSKSDQTSLTNPDYWEKTWTRSMLPPQVNIENRSLRNHATRGWHRYFESLLQPLAGVRGVRFIELGAATSKWLPYFAKHWRFEVSGLDYVEYGCESARRMLADAGAEGTIVQGDIFDPPADMKDRFDVVYSGGLIEHFENTADAVSACAQFAKPGGLIITTIPNMTGAIGSLQKKLDRSVYDKHVALDAEQLREAHVKAGLSIVDSRYFLSANFGVLNHPAVRPRILNKAIQAAESAATLSVWLAESAVTIPPTRWLSPYVGCAARKPLAS